MKRRDFTKNLSALLAIPFVAKADQYVPEVVDEIKPVDNYVEISEVFVPPKGDTVLLLEIGGKKITINLLEVSLEQNRRDCEVINEDGWIEHVKGVQESNVVFTGLQPKNLKSLYSNNECKFTLFYGEGTTFEGEGFITEVGLSSEMGSGNTIDVTIAVSGNLIDSRYNETT